MTGARAKIRTSYGLTLLALGTGALLGRYTGDWLWLSRAGSLVVVIGIVLTSTQVIEHDRRQRQRRSKWEAQLRRDVAQGPASSPSLRDFAHETNLRAMHRSRSEDEDAWELEHDGLYLLVCGTVVWGFGDLVGLLLG